ncbi:cold shock domain-containing protein [Patescibacteria group bacterium]|nr:cold shock domain-containing protein [Patescibacteria group bacterium]
MAKIVRWYKDRGFGFVNFQGHDVFMHVTALDSRQPYGVDLSNREVVVKDLMENDKGLKVTSASLSLTAEEKNAVQKEEEILAQKLADLETAKEAEEELRRKLGPATILVPVASNYYGRHVYVDNNSFEKGIIHGDYVKFELPSRARMSSLAKGVFKLTPGETYIVMHISYNAMSSVFIDKAEGLEKIFEYGDGHGMKWAALFKVTDNDWVLDFSVPNHHGHGRTKHRLIGDRSSFEKRNEDLEKEDAKRV